MDVPISTSTVLATRDRLFSTAEQLALAGFLAGYSGLTRDAYTLDLRHYVAWCVREPRPPDGSHLGSPDPPCVPGTRRLSVPLWRRASR